MKGRYHDAHMLISTFGVNARPGCQTKSDLVELPKLNGIFREIDSIISCIIGFLVFSMVADIFLYYGT